MKKTCFGAALLLSMAANAQTIYTSDGAITANRTVTLGENKLNFTGTNGNLFVNGSSGNVGIGTASPTSRLEVNGNIKMSNGEFHFGNSFFTYDQGGSMVFKADSPAATPYMVFRNSDNTEGVRMLYRNSMLNIQGSALRVDNKGLDFLHSEYGDGFGAKIYGSDEGNGTTSLRFAVRANTANWSDAMVIKTNTGKVLIGMGQEQPPTQVLGTNISNYKLFVKGGILTEEMRVSSGSSWADYVFNDDYQLRPLEEVERFIKTNKHLPNVPSAKEIKETGIELGEMTKIQQEKIEELTLYLIRQNNEIKELKEQIRILMADKK